MSADPIAGVASDGPARSAKGWSITSIDRLVPVTGLGTLKVQDGTLVLNRPLTVGVIHLQGGTITGPQRLTVNSQFDWRTGSLEGAGTQNSVVDIAADAWRGPEVRDPNLRPVAAQRNKSNVNKELRAFGSFWVGVSWHE